MHDETMPELLEVLDVDAMPEAFASRETIAVKIGGKRRAVEIDISEMDDVSRRWRRKNPRPLPAYTEQVVEPETPLARRLGHSKGMGMVKVYDEKDHAFEQQLEDWSRRHNMIVVAHCLRVELRKGGMVIEGDEERAVELERLGMTGTMASQLVNTMIQFAVSEVAEAVRFFGKDSGSDGST